MVLTKKAMGKGVEVPMAGIPYHALDDYMSRLIKAGYKLAICEQLTKPGETKGLVQRDVVRIVTPGTIIELDKIAGEPIDVLVNGKFVAKGEVVVLEESFAVRVTEIIK